jgi:acetate kinase
MRVLVVNTGSSSLKLQVLGGPGRDGPGDPDAPGPARHVADWDGRDVTPVRELLDEAGATGGGTTGPVGVDAVGHRVVHGGVDLRAPVRIDDGVVEQIRALTPLAPLHQERALAGIAVTRDLLPDVPQVACFDTAYHATLPEAAATYALPAAWRDAWPLRRFGFHGLSHAHAARRAAELTRRTAREGGTARGSGAARETSTARPTSGGSGDDRLRVVSCHLGAGASLGASVGGRSVDTTMGFTPLEGLVMGTRSGSVDPGLVLWLVRSAGLSPDEVQDGIEHRSGLAGLAGTADMAEVLARHRDDDPAARLAVEVYVHVLAREVAGMTAALGGLDALVFTGGVGEHAPEIRAATADRLPHLGVAVDPERNAAATGSPDAPSDLDISRPGAPARTLVVTAREDLEIARQTRAVLASTGAR